MREYISQIKYFSEHSYNCYKSVTSTNDILKAQLTAKTFVPQVCRALYQTHGRGQSGKKWYSSHDKSLLFSFSGESEKMQFPVSLAIGVAVFLAINDMGCVKDLWLKWPNDIWFKNGKLGGILVETVSINNVLRFVVGIGINLKTFVRQDCPCSSLADMGYDCAPDDLMLKILGHVDWVFNQGAEVLLKEWSKCANRFWKTNFEVALPDGKKLHARPLKVYKDGSLEVEQSEGERKVRLYSASLTPRF